MKKTGILLTFAATLAIGAVLLPQPQANAAQTCIQNNGDPGHAIGSFPNKGNPHSIESQDQRYCFEQAPTKGSNPTWLNGTIGVALNGIPIRPGTADFYDANSRRGFSRDSSSGWRLEGMGAADISALGEARS